MYYQPKHMLTEKNSVRRVGFELEFANLPIEQAADIICSTYTGKQSADSTQAEVAVNVDNFGKFNVELDWQYAQKKAREIKDSDNKENYEDILKHITTLASQIVPTEIVCPPIPIDNLASLDALINALRAAGAAGTDQSFVYAFGVHINPELPSLSAKTLTHYLQAFCVAQEWLVEAHGVDFSRRITPYINLYTNDYIKTVLGYNSNTSLNDIIKDYLHFNPSRNRALDLLPLLKHLDNDAIMQKLPNEKINARPTFHYRLPNCEIDKDNWQLSQCWNIWCVIEVLADDKTLLNSIKAQWLERNNATVNLKKPTWHKQLKNIQQNLLLV